MIHHYINLVCWRSMLNIYNPARDKVWIDSISLKILTARTRPDVEFRPGTTVMPRSTTDEEKKEKWFFLTSVLLKNLPTEAQYALPFFDEIYVPETLAVWLDRLPAGSRVAIGISAPKQNYLAAKLYDRWPNLEYHCIGAALSEFDPKQSDSPSLAGSGLEWLRFLVSSPRRTLGKISQTISELRRILFEKESREKFARFASICEAAEYQKCQDKTLELKK